MKKKVKFQKLVTIRENQRDRKLNELSLKYKMLLLINYICKGFWGFGVLGFWV